MQPMPSGFVPPAPGGAQAPIEQTPAPRVDGLSPRAHRWLDHLAHPRAWAAATTRDAPVDFLFALVEVLGEMDVFPAPDEVLASWVTFGGGRPPRVRQRDLPYACPAGAAVPIPRPWLGGFENYDGERRLMLGLVRDPGGSAEPVVSQTCALGARRAFEMLASSARDAHRRRGQAWPSCCDDAMALREALCRFLGTRPDLTEALAARFPLQQGIRPWPRPLAAEIRQAQRTCHSGRDARPEDLRLPPEVLRALLPDGGSRLSGRWRRQQAELRHRLPLMPMAWSMCFGAQGGRLSVHGRQCLEPSLIRGRSPQAMRALLAGVATPTRRARRLFDAGQDLAVAVSAGLLASWQVGQVSWMGDPTLPSEEGRG